MQQELKSNSHIEGPPNFKPKKQFQVCHISRTNIVLTALWMILSALVSRSSSLVFSFVGNSKLKRPVARVPSLFNNRLHLVHKMAAPEAETETHNTDPPEAKRPKLEEPRADVPLYRAEGLFSVQKPLKWTSQDAVAYIRKMLEQDAKIRGFKDDRHKKRKPLLKIGHGGTLDPLATGVLVIGLGNGTKGLQQ